MIYLDYAATTPMTSEAIEAYREAATIAYGNTSSLHDEGGKAALILENARTIIAKKLGVNRDGVIFTGGGTESNILGILSLARAGHGKHIITSKGEHTSVHAAMNTLEREGFEITKLSFLKNGCIDLEELKKEIRDDTVLISIQHVNSETGVIQPIDKISEIARKRNICVHVDCVQSFCKLPIETFSHLVDAISVSAHKVGGPKGCGALYLNPYRKIVPVFPGLTHERGIRGGTVDTPAIVSMACAVETFSYRKEAFWKYRLKLKKMLKNTFFYFVETEDDHQLPSICGMFTQGIEGQFVMLRLNEKGICISTGSACDVHSSSGTKAILAMGYGMNEARQFFRISFGSNTTEEEIETLGNALIALSREFTD